MWVDRLFKHLKLILIKILKDLSRLQISFLYYFDGARDLRFLVLTELDLPKGSRSKYFKQVVVVSESIHVFEGTR